MSDYPYEEEAVGAWTVRRFDSIDSTNGYLAALPPEARLDRLVAVARHQTAGRGRRGRVWDDRPDASLLFSVLLPKSTAAPALATFAMALAVTDAASVVAGVKATLKWPNDVLVGGRKVAGILAETASNSDAVVVGCGVNLNWGGELPESLTATAISMDEAAGAPVSLDTFLPSVLQALGTRLSRPDWLLQSYRGRCSTIGQSVLVELADQTLEGIAVDVTDEGALVLETTDGRQELTVGDVVHLRGS